MTKSTSLYKLTGIRRVANWSDIYVIYSIRTFKKGRVYKQKQYNKNNATKDAAQKKTTRTAVKIS